VGGAQTFSVLRGSSPLPPPACRGEPRGCSGRLVVTWDIEAAVSASWWCRICGLFRDTGSRRHLRPAMMPVVMALSTVSTSGSYHSDRIDLTVGTYRDVAAGARFGLRVVCFPAASRQSPAARSSRRSSSSRCVVIAPRPGTAWRQPVSPNAIVSSVLVQVMFSACPSTGIDSG
jgi:hypothetical protein